MIVQIRLVMGLGIVVQAMLGSIVACSAAVPMPALPDANKSLLYRVFADRTEIPVDSELSGNRVVETAAFRSGSPIKLQILVRESFSELKIRPLRYGLSQKAKVAFVPPNRLRIELQVRSPGYYVVEPNGLPPLVLMCLPHDEELPKPTDPDVLYFGPGVHEPGRICVRSNQTIFLDAGAKVYGTIEGTCVENVRITGRGHLYGTKHTSWNDRTYGIVFDRSKNITVEKIGIRDCYWWTTNFVLCNNVTIRDVNVLSFNKNSSTLMIDGCSKLIVRDSIIMCRDDCIASHALNAAGNGEEPSDDMLFENLVLYNVIDGNAIRLGASFETQEVRNWTFRNIDIVHRAGAAVYADHSDWATVRNLLFENVADEATTGNSIHLFVAKTRYSCQTGYRDARGQFDGLYFKNYVSAGGAIVLAGHDHEHAIRDVVFAGCKIGKAPLREVKQISTNEFVYDVRILPHADNLAVEPVTSAENRHTLSENSEELLIDDSNPLRFRSYGFRQAAGAVDAFGKSESVGVVADRFGQYAAAVYEPGLCGRYEILAYWGQHKEMDEHAPWIVRHRDGYARAYQNQNDSPGWHSLGIFELTSSSNVRLVYPNYFRPTSKPVVADAVKFVRRNR